MNMPNDRIDPVLFAPCGMNCMVCYRHCYHKKPCAGCRNHDTGKPEHCRKCKIKDCLKTKELRFCYECSAFPCQQIKNLEKSYQTRYETSLIENSLFVRERGLIEFMERQKAKFTCPHCGGVISLHDAQCSECQQKIKTQGEP